MKSSIVVITIFAILLFITGCGSDLSPDEKALNIVKESQVLGGNISVETFIRNWLQKRKDKIKPLGWTIEKRAELIYLVSFHYRIHSFAEGLGERAYFFEVNLDTEAVRNVTREFVKEMEPLQPLILDEEKLVEELVKKQLEEGNK